MLRLLQALPARSVYQSPLFLWQRSTRFGLIPLRNDVESTSLAVARLIDAISSDCADAASNTGRLHHTTHVVGFVEFLAALMVSNHANKYPPLLSCLSASLLSSFRTFSSLSSTTCDSRSHLPSSSTAAELPQSQLLLTFG